MLFSTPPSHRQPAQHPSQPSQPVSPQNSRSRAFCWSDFACFAFFSLVVPFLSCYHLLNLCQFFVGISHCSCFHHRKRLLQVLRSVHPSSQGACEPKLACYSIPTFCCLFLSFVLFPFQPVLDCPLFTMSPHLSSTVTRQSYLTRTEKSTGRSEARPCNVLGMLTLICGSCAAHTFPNGNTSTLPQADG